MQYYERLVPAGTAAAAAAEPAEPSKDFSSLIQSEVEDVKSKGKPKLVQYHNTNVGGIMFFILSKEAGNLWFPSSLACRCLPASTLTTWHACRVHTCRAADVHG